MPSVLKIVIVAVVVIAIAISAIIFLPRVQFNPIEDSERTKWTTYSDYVTIGEENIYNLSASIVGGRKIITDFDILKIQDWITNNIRHVPEDGVIYPLQVLKDKSGNTLSIALLELSMIYTIDPGADSYLALVDISYFGDQKPRWSYAVLTLFGDNVMISDTSLPTGLLTFVCRIETPENCLRQIINHVPYVYDYTVTHIISSDIERGFSDTEDFIKWLKA